MLTCTSERNSNTRSNEFARLIKKYRVQGSRFRSNISETVRDIRVPFSLLGRCKSHATKRCNPRLCSCYRFWDIVVANINNFPILLDFTRANTYMASNEFARHNKEIFAFWAVFPVKYLRNGRRYSSSVWTVAKGNSRATQRCKRRFCRSYRFWDMKSSTSELRNADLYERAKSIPVRMNSHG